MGLTQALQTSVTGLRATQAGLSLIASNVANAQTPGYVRKTLQRAQAKFADLLLDRVAESLDDPAADLEAELRELDLLKYCRTALGRRRSLGKRLAGPDRAGKRDACPTTGHRRRRKRK